MAAGAGKAFMTLGERIRLCKEYTTLWSDFFGMFAEELEHKKVLPNDERAFAQIVSLLALKHYKFTEMMGNKLPEPEAIREVLCEAVSLQHLKGLSEAQFSKLQVDWHTQFIAMNKCLGKLIAELPLEQRPDRQAQRPSAVPQRTTSNRSTAAPRHQEGGIKNP